MGALNRALTRYKYITPKEIAGLLSASNTAIIGDFLNFKKEIGEDNTAPLQPSTSGVRGRFDAS